MKVLVEGKYGHGSKPQPIKRFFRRLYRRSVGRHIKASVPFDWSVGYDIRSKIGAVTVKNQGTSDSCGGQAGSYGLEALRRLRGINEGAISAKSIYAPIAYPGGGTTVKDLETQLGAHGANLESAVPSYDAYGNPLSEAMMIERSWQTPQAVQDALTRAGLIPFDVSIDMDSIALAIQNYIVIWVIQGQNGLIPGWLSSTPQPPTSAEWEHFEWLPAAKMFNGQNAIVALNSWGTEVGINGDQFFFEDYINSGYVKEVIAFVPDSVAAPIPSNVSIWAEIARYFRSLWGLAGASQNI